MSEDWIAERMHRIDASGIRKVFDLGARLKDPINLSIGQPHFDTPEQVKQALCQAIADGKNAYSQTQGIPTLIDRLQARIDAQYGHADRKVFITSGTSGGLTLSLSILVNPGDEVIVFSPYFVMYRHLTTLVGGKVVEINTFPDFRVDLDRVRQAITPKTKVIVFNSPNNPTGALASAAEVEGLARLAAEHDIALLSDEIYHDFCYDQPFVSPARFNDQTIVVDGFSKSHSMTGLRLGYAHAPSALVQQMLKLQQFTFVCAPHPVQYAGLAALDCDISDRVRDYHRKRDFVVSQLSPYYEIPRADAAFFLLPKAPWGTATDFCTEAISRGLLIIPSNVFCPQDTHFRLSYAADDRTLERGCTLLRELAQR